MEIRGISTVPVNRPAASTSEAAAPFVQPGTDTSATASGTASGTAGGGQAEPKALSAGGGYISPFLRYDQAARVAVLYFRDIDTGETQSQIPSARVVEEYRRTAGRLSPREDSADGTVQTGGTGADRTAGSTAGTPAGTGAGTAAGAGTGAQAAAPTFFGAASTAGGGSDAAAGTPVPSGGGPSATPSYGSTAGLPAAGLPVGGGGGFGAPTGGLVSVTV